ncbi:tyrosine-type recombinase/integrase [Sphaerotilus microaerophilus]|uniref:Integrase n=1 Tax=Sphaerotilus microaerophilus TaxID=2914710 RepID=A0ABN6PRV6_9BURK|nr:integrase arm-type DNA-binding domain-containing protein [Sphaerotilus sp. FB-5]BDI07127.1 integrase [Sphaerotilus sp. FB-5]
MLTDADCRNAICPEGKPRARLADAGGLYLEVTPNGARRWFVKYRFGGKEKRLAVGNYPGVSLKDARKARDEARKTRERGADPVQARQIERATASTNSATTFEAVAREFHHTKAGGWSTSYAEKWLRLVEKDLFPWLGTLPLADVSAPVLLAALRRTEARGAHNTAHELRQYAGQVFRYGVATGRCERNPTADLAGALKPLQVKHMAAVLDPAGVGALLRNISGYAGHPLTRAALALSALLFQRPGNIRAMEWGELDTDAALWTIPAAKMKRTVHGKVNGRPHLVPLAPQALAILEELRPLSGRGRFVFPSLLGDGECMSENTIRAALRRMGYTNDEMTAHGFRAMARTLIGERLPGIHQDVIEAQLAHGKAGPLGMAYDRAEYMEQRRQMMQAWADYLDRLRAGAQVLPFKAA